MLPCFKSQPNESGVPSACGRRLEVHITVSICAWRQLVEKPAGAALGFALFGLSSRCFPLDPGLPSLGPSHAFFALALPQPTSYNHTNTERSETGPSRTFPRGRRLITKARAKRARGAERKDGSYEDHEASPRRGGLPPAKKEYIGWSSASPGGLGGPRKERIRRPELSEPRGVWGFSPQLNRKCTGKCNAALI